MVGHPHSGRHELLDHDHGDAIRGDVGDSS